MAFCCILHSLSDQAKYGARHSNHTRCCGYFNLTKIFSYEQDIHDQAPMKATNGYMVGPCSSIHKTGLTGS